MIEVAGESIEEKQLEIAKARELAAYLSRGIHPSALLVGLFSRHDIGIETLVFDVRVELSQVRKYPILPVERISVSFTATDDQLPEVVSLREDFPLVPHLNDRLDELPRSLCLYDISYEALKLRWTAAAFIERIREWLSLTAEGKLHHEDQPLEPLILGSFWPLILPATFLADVAEQPEKRKRYGVNGLAGDNDKPNAYKLVAEGTGVMTHVVTVFVSAPREHGVVRRAPSNLKDLISLCELSGLDLRAHLRAEVPRWKDDPTLRKMRMLLVTVFPKLRASGAEITESDTLAFELGCSVEDIGERLGLWIKSPSGTLGAVVGQQEETTEQVSVSILNPVVELTKAKAAKFNGTEANDQSLVMVGVGALGSLLLNQLTRKGFGLWTVVDDETMLPHNAARHLLPGNAAGFLKAQAVRTVLNVNYHEAPVAKALAANSLHPAALKQELEDALANAYAIVDCSADVPTARSLSLEAPGLARRVSVFLSPSGEDLVVLAEDSGRAIKLDALEMQYYRMLIRTPELFDHLSTAISRIRYGRSCRDLSATLSGDVIAMHAAIASRALPLHLAQDKATIRIWRANPDGAVQLFSSQVAESIRVRAGDLTIVWDMDLVQKLRALRADKLPKETGGALLGNWDRSRRILYLVEVLSARLTARKNRRVSSEAVQI